MVRICADGKRAKLSHRRLRNGISGRTLDCDQSEILARQTGRTEMKPRVVAPPAIPRGRIGGIKPQCPYEADGRVATPFAICRPANIVTKLGCRAPLLRRRRRDSAIPSADGIRQQRRRSRYTGCSAKTLLTSSLTSSATKDAGGSSIAASSARPASVICHPWVSRTTSD